MPKTNYEFKVELCKTSKPCFASRVHTTDPALLDQLAALGYPLIPWKGGERVGSVVKVVDDLGSQRLVHALSILEHSGFRPYPHLTAPSDAEAQGYFTPRRERNYSRAEVKKAELLIPHPNFGGEIANLTGCLDGRWMILADKRQKNQVEVGHPDVGVGLLCIRGFVDALHDAGMKEARWDEVHYYNPSKVIKPIGVLSSIIQMPPCLTPRQGEGGEVWMPGGQPGHTSAYWDDQGHVPPELKFERSAVASLGAFDIAMTREQTGHPPGYYIHTLVVSQRFREFVEKRKVRNASFVPVKLV
jgi:hypothetical protein